MTGITVEAMAIVLQLMAPLTLQEHPHVQPLDVSPEDVFCLAQNAFWEARNQSEEGRLAVAFVTLNRVRSRGFPDNICDVVWQRRQFSWTHDGKSDKIPPVRVRDGTWERTVRVALRALSPYSIDITDNSLYYHAYYVKPHWAERMEMVIAVDDHLFYREVASVR